MKTISQAVTSISVVAPRPDLHVDQADERMPENRLVHRFVHHGHGLILGVNREHEYKREERM